MCAAFRAQGHDAWSCDLQPTRGNPDWHYQQDIMDVVSLGWDLIILHPDCTAMALSGNRWYGAGMPYSDQRTAAIKWTVGLWRESIKHADSVALENPASVIFKHLDAQAQYIQPWMFGHGEVKRTGFALHNLLPLVPTDIVDGREERIWRMPPSPTRKRDRSVTYQGIADAIADQWGGL